MATNTDVYFSRFAKPVAARVEREYKGSAETVVSKGPVLSVHSQANLNKVAHQLDERPRETLQFETPAENLMPVLRRPVEPAPVRQTFSAATDRL